jgi:hypothetical protein
MKCFLNNNRNFFLISLEKKKKNILPCENYVVLVNARTENTIMKLKERMNFLIAPQCKEIYGIGRFAERLHDVFDEYIEDHDIRGILTSADEDIIAIDDICFYFFEAAGGKNIPNLFAFIDNEKDIENVLIDYFLNLKMRTSL